MSHKWPKVRLNRTKRGSRSLYKTGRNRTTQMTKIVISVIFRSRRGTTIASLAPLRADLVHKRRSWAIHLNALLRELIQLKAVKENLWSRVVDLRVGKVRTHGSNNLTSSNYQRYQRLRKARFLRTAK